MKKGFRRAMAILAAVALVFTSMPAMKAEAKTKTPAAKPATSITVKSQLELTAAMISGKYTDVRLETDKKLTIIVSGLYSVSKINLTVNAPKSTIVNNGYFKSIVIEDAKEFDEFALNNSIKITDNKLDFTAALLSKVKSLTVAGEGVLNIENYSTISSLVVESGANIKITGLPLTKTSVTVQPGADGASITTELPVKVDTYSGLDLTLNRGAENSAVTLKSADAGITLANNTRASVTVRNFDGSIVNVKRGEVYDSAEEEPDAPLTASAAFTLSDCTATLNGSVEEDVFVTYTGTDTLTIKLGTFAINGTFTITAPETKTINIEDEGVNALGAIIENLVIDAPKAHVVNSAAISGKVTVKAVSNSTFVQEDSASAIDVDGTGAVEVSGDIAQTPAITVNTDEDVTLKGDIDSVNIAGGANVTVGDGTSINNVTVSGNGAGLDVASGSAIGTVATSDSATGTIAISGDGSVGAVDATSGNADGISVDGTDVSNVVANTESTELTGVTAKTVTGLEFNVPTDFNGNPEGFDKIAKLRYFVGEAPDYTGIQLIVTYSEGEPSIVETTPDMFSGLNTAEEGIYEVFVTYGGVTIQFLENVEVIDAHFADSRATVLQRELWAAKAGSVVELNESITIGTDTEFECLDVPAYITLKVADNAQITFKGEQSYIHVSGILDVKRAQLKNERTTKEWHSMIGLIKGAIWMNGEASFVGAAMSNTSYYEVATLFYDNSEWHESTGAIDIWWISSSLDINNANVLENNDVLRPNVKTYSMEPDSDEVTNIELSLSNDIHDNEKTIRVDGEVQATSTVTENNKLQAEIDDAFDQGLGGYTLTKSITLEKGDILNVPSKFTLTVAEGVTITCTDWTTVNVAGTLVLNSIDQVAMNNAVDDNGNFCDDVSAIVMSPQGKVIIGGVEIQYSFPKYDFVDDGDKWNFWVCYYTIFKYNGIYMTNVNEHVVITDPHDNITNTGIQFFGADDVVTYIGSDGEDVMKFMPWDIYAIDRGILDEETPVFDWLDIDATLLDIINSDLRFITHSKYYCDKWELLAGSDQYILDSELVVPDGKVLSISSGSELKLTANGSIICEDGGCVVWEEAQLNDNDNRYVPVGRIVDANGVEQTINPITGRNVPVGSLGDTFEVSSPAELQRALDYYNENGGGKVVLSADATWNLSYLTTAEDGNLWLYIPKNVKLVIPATATVKIDGRVRIEVVGSIEGALTIGDTVVEGLYNEENEEYYSECASLGIRGGASWTNGTVTFTNTSVSEDVWSNEISFNWDNGHFYMGFNCDAVVEDTSDGFSSLVGMNLDYSNWDNLGSLKLVNNGAEYVVHPATGEIVPADTDLSVAVVESLDEIIRAFDYYRNNGGTVILTEAVTLGGTADEWQEINVPAKIELVIAENASITCNAYSCVNVNGVISTVANSGIIFNNTFEKENGEIEYEDSVRLLCGGQWNIGHYSDGAFVVDRVYRNTTEIPSDGNDWRAFVNFRGISDGTFMGLNNEGTIEFTSESLTSDEFAAALNAELARIEKSDDISLKINGVEYFVNPMTGKFVDELIENPDEESSEESEEEPFEEESEEESSEEESEEESSEEESEGESSEEESEEESSEEESEEEPVEESDEENND